MRRGPLILILLFLASLGYGLIHLFALRFKQGDVYPEYSSLRSDPLGSKVLFLSLQNLLPTQRHTRPLVRLEGGPDTTLYILGAELDSLRLNKREVEALEKFLHQGGRIVLAFYPMFYPPSRNQGFGALADFNLDQITLLIEHWGLSIHYGKLEKSSDDVFLPAPAFLQAKLDLPEKLDCHSVIHFSDPDSLWTPIYTRENGDLIILERSWGDGSIVIAGDSYLLSNEAMLNDRMPRLLSWLQGRNQQALFEESHLGVSQSPGIMNLAWKYRLHGVAGCLAILAGLFLWKSACPFPPLTKEKTPASFGAIPGKDSASGFDNLLRRNVPRSKIMHLCLEQWRIHQSNFRHLQPARLRAVQDLIDAENLKPEKERDPVQLYDAISRALDTHQKKSTKDLSPSSPLIN